MDLWVCSFLRVGCEQWSALVNQSTVRTGQIGRLKNEYGEKRPMMESLTEVFGEKLSYRWLLPCGDSAHAYTEHAYSVLSTSEGVNLAPRLGPRIDLV